MGVLFTKLSKMTYSNSASRLTFSDQLTDEKDDVLVKFYWCGILETTQ